MNTSEKLDLLLPALAKARLQFGEIKKSKTNPHFKSKYAALDDILPVIGPPLATEGLLLIGDISTVSEGVVTVTTRLMHTSEQWIESVVHLAYQWGNLQGLGRDITYARRYSINTMLQLAADEDLDEHGVQGGERHTPETRRPQRETQAPETDGQEHPTMDQITSLVEFARACGVDLVSFGHYMRQLMALDGETPVTKKFLRETMSLAQFDEAWQHHQALVKDQRGAEVIDGDEHDEDDVPDYPPHPTPQDATNATTVVDEGEVHAEGRALSLLRDDRVWNRPRHSESGVPTDRAPGRDEGNARAPDSDRPLLQGMQQPPRRQYSGDSQRTPSVPEGSTSQTVQKIPGHADVGRGGITESETSTSGVRPERYQNQSQNPPEASMVENPSPEASEKQPSPQSPPDGQNGESATDAQMEALKTLAKKVGPDAEADLQDTMEHHHGRLPLNVYETIKAYLEKRQATAATTAAKVKAETPAATGKAF